MVTPRYVPFLGGVELHVYQVARRLAARGVQVTVLTTDPSRELPAKEELEGVRVRRVPAWPRGRDYYFAPGIYKEITAGQWDVVHVQSYHTLVAPLAMLAARRARTPYLVTFHAGGHSSAVRHASRPLQLLLLRPLLADAERLIALAPFEIDHYANALRLPPEHFVVVPNGSDLPEHAALKTIRRVPGLIASLGRLERYKGHQHVIAALPYILQERPEARLWIAGSGPYETSLRQLAASLGVSEHVYIRAIPVEARDKLAEELSRVKVVVSLSEFETQPIALLEALTLGCRLVVANTRGLNALAEGGLALSVPLESSPECVAAAVLEEMKRPPRLDNPRLPTWDDCANSLYEVYVSIARQSTLP